MTEKATVEEFRLILKMISRGYKVPKIIHDVILDVAKREIEEKERVVLYKRDPNVNSRRIHGAYVRVIEGNCIEIHPTACGGFGADFDGDTMAVYTPISEESQKEIKTKMISAKHTSGLNVPNFSLSMEMLTGIFTLTTNEKGNVYKKIKDVQEAKLLSIDQKIEVSFKGNQKTTAGRLIFNMNLPEWYPYVNESVPKGKVNEILQNVLERDEKEYANLVDKLMRLGFLYATINPKTFSLDLTKINDKLLKLKSDLMKAKTVSEQMNIVDQMEDTLIQHLKETDSDLYYWVQSGGSKGRNQIRQVLVAKGITQDPNGNVLPPIAKAMNDGYTPEEYFNASAAGRKGIIDRSLNTAYGGYAYRKMVFVMGNCLANVNTSDCGTKLTLDIKMTKDIFKRMKGRFCVENGKIVPITKEMIGQVVKVRSPIFCKTLEICRTCYGQLLGQLKSKNIGIIAAQEVASLSEKIMKAFHLGGALILEKTDIIKELMDNLDDVYEPVLRKAFTQKVDDLINNKDMTIVKLKTSIYQDEYKIQNVQDGFLLPVGHFTILCDDLEIIASIEKEVLLYPSDTVERDRDEITIIYGKNDKIMKVEPKKEDFSKLAQELDKLVAGKSPWSDVPSLYKKFYKNLSVVGDWDSVHLETIISNILRSKKDPQKPARIVSPFEPVTFSIKKLPSIISYPLGIAFENFSKSIQYGLVSERSPESPIEKVMFGSKFVED